MLKELIKHFELIKKEQDKCPHKKVKLFEYKTEYPAGGLRCIKCGYITKLFATKRELKGRS